MEEVWPFLYEIFFLLFPFHFISASLCCSSSLSHSHGLEISTVRKWEFQKFLLEFVAEVVRLEILVDQRGISAIG